MPRGRAGVERVSVVGPQALAQTEGGPSAVTDWRRFATMLGFVALPVFAFDQLVKLYIVGHLETVRANRRRAALARDHLHLEFGRRL